MEHRREHSATVSSAVTAASSSLAAVEKSDSGAAREAYTVASAATTRFLAAASARAKTGLSLPSAAAAAAAGAPAGANDGAGGAAAGAPTPTSDGHGSSAVAAAAAAPASPTSLASLPRKVAPSMAPPPGTPTCAPGAPAPPGAPASWWATAAAAAAAPAAAAAATALVPAHVLALWPRSPQTPQRYLRPRRVALRGAGVRERPPRPPDEAANALAMATVEGAAGITGPGGGGLSTAASAADRMEWVRRLDAAARSAAAADDASVVWGGAKGAPAPAPAVPGVDGCVAMMAAEQGEAG